MKVQIYLTSAEDARMCVAEGVDFIGVVADENGRTPSSLSYATARSVLSEAAPDRTRVALTLDFEVADLVRLVEQVEPDVLHLAATGQRILPATLRTLRCEAPQVKLMYAIAMNSGDPSTVAAQFQQWVDYFILDTSDPTRADLGATGRTHDWNLSATLVRQVRVPVILAGGLSPENVAEAVRTVRPWGVDSFSHTNASPSLEKDARKVRAFVANARIAAGAK